MVAGYIITTIIGALVGFFFARWMFKRELKKNPPISEKMIRAMFMEIPPLTLNNYIKLDYVCKLF